MMKRIFLSLILFAALGASAQVSDSIPNVLTARKCFATVPMSVIGVINESVRLDMIDYFDHQMSNHSQNDMGNDCYIKEMNDYSIVVQNGNGVEMQMFVLNPEDTLPMIGVVETLETPVEDSSLHFYTSKWAPLDMLISVKPVLKDWILPSAKKKVDDIERVLPFIMVKYSYDPDTHILTATNNMDAYFYEKDKPVELSYLKPELKYRWDGNKFKMLK